MIWRKHKTAVIVNIHYKIIPHYNSLYTSSYLFVSYDVCKLLHISDGILVIERICSEGFQAANILLGQRLDI